MAKKKTESVERTLVDDILDETFAQLSNRGDFDNDLLQELRIVSATAKMTKTSDIQALIQKAASRTPNETA